MRKTNEELDSLIAEQETLLSQDAGKVDIRRGHVTRTDGELVKNRRDAIKALESGKEMVTVNLKAGI